MGFAKELTVLRAKKKISLQKLAEEVGVSKTHIWQLEKGVSKDPSLDIVKRIADYFNVSIQSLLSEDIESSNANPLSVAMYRKFDELDEMDKRVVLQMVDTMRERQKQRENDVRPGKT